MTDFFARKAIIDDTFPTETQHSVDLLERARELTLRDLGLNGSYILTPHGFVLCYDVNKVIWPDADLLGIENDPGDEDSFDKVLWDILNALDSYLLAQYETLKGGQGTGDEINFSGALEEANDELDLDPSEAYDVFFLALQDFEDELGVKGQYMISETGFSLTGATSEDMEDDMERFSVDSTAELLPALKEAFIDKYYEEGTRKVMYQRTSKETVIKPQKGQDKPGKFLLQWNPGVMAGENLTEEWQYLLDALTEIIEMKNPDGEWKIDDDEFFAKTGKDFLNQVLSYEENVFEIHTFKARGLALKDVGKGEWKFFTPKKR